MWATERSDSYTATNDDKPTAKNGTTTGTVTSTNSISWTYSVTQETKSNKNPYSAYSDENGWQLGSSNSPCKAFSISTSGITGNITNIVVEAGSYNASSSINVTVGGNVFGTQGQTTGDGNVKKITFSGSATGEIIVSATASTRAFYFKSVTVTYDDGPAKLAHDLSWGITSKDVTYSEKPYGLPTLTNPHSLPIVYSSDNTSVATIDASGVVTVKNVTGSAKIYASTTGDDTYAAGSVYYTLNVTRKVVIEDGVFNFGFGENYESGAVYKTTSNIDMAETEWTAGNIILNVAGRNIWEEASGALKLYKASSSQTTPGNITLSCPSGNVITKVEFTGVTGTGALSNMDSNIGDYSVNGATATWTGAAPSINFTATNSTYIYTITVTYGTNYTQTVESYGWATYITPAPVQFNSGDAYVVTAASVADGLTIEGVTNVPANTPVLLKGAGDKTITVLTTAPDAPATNLLEVCNGTIASGKYPFVLAKNGEGACFKQWTGEAAVLNNRVVLPLNESIATARSIFMLDGETQGISDIVTISDNRYYDLQGRSVMQPKKGLYIVNGKKVIMK